MAISLTPHAADRVKGLLDRLRAPQTACLRIRIRSGGCLGSSYALNVTDAPADDDAVETCHGVRVVCDPKSLPHLDGTQIDYTDSPAPGGFVFRNPHARRLCNCGASFRT